MLEVAHLDVAYGAAQALWGVSLSVAAGDIACIVGPNGAGKTTLMNTVAGLVRPRKGRLVFDGVDLRRLPAHRVCEIGIAIVPEGRRLFTDMTVRENLELGSFRRRARKHRQSSLDQVFSMFPILRERLLLPAGTLSGGQQQMLAIARALMARPRLLLLDEPSLGLAPAIVLDMFSSIRRIHAEGVTILLSEQNIALALDIATRACVLEGGRIVAEGEPATLFRDPRLRRAYLGDAPERTD